MSSTRNRNDPGNYQSEERSREEQRMYSMFQNQGNGQAFNNNLAGNGLLAGQMGLMPLSRNFVDIDSYLKGTGSSNLVTPMPIVQPQYKSLNTLDIFEKSTLIIPKPLRHIKNQRPLLS
jgi:hypothetical protein